MKDLPRQHRLRNKKNQMPGGRLSIISYSSMKFIFLFRCMYALLPVLNGIILQIYSRYGYPVFGRHQQEIYLPSAKENFTDQRRV